MKILLPPSEGKTPAASGPALDFEVLSAPDLNRHRKKVLTALKRVSKRKDALQTLGVGASLAEDVHRNVELESIACAPSLATYSGVLYDAMAAADLVHAAEADGSLRSKLEDVHVFSALFGQVNGLDRIPAYRLAMKTHLGTMGKLTSWWKPILAKSFTPDPDEVLLDCRSSDYRAAWPGPKSQVVALGALKVTGTKRSVISHWAKYYRGEFVGRLLADSRPLPATVDSLVERAGEHYEVEHSPAQGASAASLTILVKG